MPKGIITILGGGPAGLFAADTLSKAGIPCRIIELGYRMSERVCPEDKNCDCIVCDALSGFGGAGGFSDGKSTYSLTRGTQTEVIFDESCAEHFKVIDELTVKFGGEGKLFSPLKEIPEEFKGSKFSFESYNLRHLGSDGIRKLIQGLVESLEARGVEILPYTSALNIWSDPDGGYNVTVKDHPTKTESSIHAEELIVATGLQGAAWLEEQAEHLGIPLAHGPAGIGIRFEAKASTLKPLFDRFYDFKLTYETPWASFRSFCCNQRGHVLNENHNTLGIRNVNGHSFLDEGRRTDSSNFAIIAKIDNRVTGDPQEFVRNIARGINSLVGGGTVVQRARDFVLDKASKYIDDEDEVVTDLQSRSGVHIGSAMPSFLYGGFRGFLMDLDKIVPGILHESSVIYAPEMKYFGKKSPINFGSWECDGYPGLYIIGNASGYLDSFVSAALTGMIAANNIIERRK